MARYAVADLHGRYDLFQMIKEYLQPEDTLYVLGDCADRGPDGWKIIKEVYNNPQMIYLLGNHEDMLVDAMNNHKDLCFYNSGKVTYMDWLKESKENRKLWKKRIRNLPKEIQITNNLGQQVILCHSGYTPHIDYDSDDKIWNRDHIADSWEEDLSNHIVVHGHTPVPNMEKHLWGIEHEYCFDDCALWYCSDENGKFHKLDIDAGAVWTNKIAIIDLDTWKGHVFKSQQEIIDE